MLLPYPHGRSHLCFLPASLEKPHSWGKSTSPLPSANLLLHNRALCHSEFIIPDAGGVPPLLLVATWNLGMMSGAPVAILDHLATREVKTLC